MSVLLLVEHDNTNLSPLTARALAAAREMAGEAEIDLLVAGKDCVGVAEQAAGLAGVSRVLLCQDAALEHGLEEPLCTLMSSRADRYETIVAPATSTGKRVMPRLAAVLDRSQVSGITRVIDVRTFERPIYAGNALQIVQTGSAAKIVTVRSSAFAPVSGGEEGAPVEPVPMPALSPLVRWISDTDVSAERPDLATARIVVGGGRALETRQRFEELVVGLADVLGAAVGATRAAVEEGLAPNEWQVGQTGRSIAPDLYIACGVSGAAQHLSGIRDAKTVIAINSDPDAPIFAAADYGLVANVEDVLPALIASLARQ